MRTIYRRGAREAVWDARSLRAGREAKRAGRLVEPCDELTAYARELRAFRSRQRFAALHREGDARVSLRAIHEHLEVQVRRGGEPRHADEADGLANADPRAATSAAGEASQVTVPAYESVPMA